MGVFNSNLSETYGLQSWSNGYFSIDRSGNLCVNYGIGFKKRCPLERIYQKISQTVTDKTDYPQLPVILHFNHILDDRVKKINQTFKQTIDNALYQGSYQLAYPIKSNPSQRILAELIELDSITAKPIAFEVGSKTELLAIMSVHQHQTDYNHRRIICNGFKDKAYLTLCQIANRIGFDIIVVIEHAKEFDLIQSLYQNELSLPFSLGLRLKPTKLNIHALKFGLNLKDAYEIVGQMPASWQNQIRLLHVHHGSQITKIHDIASELKRAITVYAALKSCCDNLTIIDLGGGLALAYHTEDKEQIDYTLEDYSQSIIQTIQTYCDELEVAHPDLISESGRYTVSHSAVLLTNIHHISKPILDLEEKLLEQIKMLNQDDVNWQQLLEEKKYSLIIEAAFNLLYKKSITLEAYAEIESLTQLILTPVEHLAWLNLSVFQSLPDHWGLNQAFPILPIQSLNQPTDQKALLFDLSCDKDGLIQDYVTSKQQPKAQIPSLPLANIDDKTTFALFLIGSYQEILGSYHNLIGRVPVIEVSFDAQSKEMTLTPKQNETTKEILNQFGYEVSELYQIIQRQLKQQVDGYHLTTLLNEFNQILYENAYLNVSEHKDKMNKQNVIESNYLIDPWSTDYAEFKTLAS